MQPSRLPIALATLATVVAACIAGPAAPEAPSLEAPAGESPPLSSDEAPPAASDEAPPPARDVTGTAAPAPVVREGGALVRAPDAAALYLADEDHAVVRRIPLPIDEAAPPRAFPMPGRPAQVLAVDHRVLVTVRDPGLLLVLRESAGELVEEGRVALPADAWGIAVTADGRRALVSSAWTHRVSLVDLDELRVRWSVEVAREPRGIAVRADGKEAWVTHLVGAELTKIEQLDATEPAVRRVLLPADPLRSPVGEPSGASLGYAAALSEDERRLYVARHAIGGLGWRTWEGTSSVDVLATATDEPVAPRRAGPDFATPRPGFTPTGLHDRAGQLPETQGGYFVQPRAMVVRHRASTLLVASEGHDALVELDARAVAPGLAPLRVYALAGPERRVDLSREEWGGGLSFGVKIATSACGAPTGVALSADEETAYVYCRSTDGLAVVPLATYGIGSSARPYRREETYVVARLAAAPLPEPLATGRRLFYDALEPVVSGGLACSGCHPEGRDDAFVWREIHPHDAGPFFVGSPASLPAQEHPDAGTLGRARQTPMLAGRVGAPGPYGWLAESATLVGRIREGFGLHRWSPPGLAINDATTQKMRAEPLAAFLRDGLVPPPARTVGLSEGEERGQAIFLSDQAGCARCHDPASDYTSRLALPLPGRRRARSFDPDPAPAFKIPSLFYVGETAPYFHDGTVATLEELIEMNLDHMGMTTHLEAGERADLAAFLRTIAPESEPAAPALAEPVPWRPERTPVLPPDQRGPQRPLAPPEPEDVRVPPFTAEPWSEVPSPEPSRAEWGDAPKVRLSRSGGGCSAKRVREWLRIACSGNFLLFVGGTRAGLTLSANPELDVTPTMTFPVRRRDRRVVELGAGWKWMTPFAIFSEQWLEGDPQPVVAVDSVYSPDIEVLP
jgi:DNA-binding beta-propeller fold protein YncE